MSQFQGGKRPPTKLVAALAAPALGVTLSLVTAPAAQAAEGYFCSDGTQPYVSVATAEAFSAGTAVTGLSVTSGTEPSKFTGSYIGYIDDGLGLDRDMLLFRLSSDVIDGTGGLKPAGIWAGMSGSPVYTSDGQLIGAVAYSLNYDNLPVAGVTPAEYMKSIGSTAVGTSGKVKATASKLKIAAGGAKIAGTDLAGRTFSEVKSVDVAGAAGKKANAFTNRTLARTPKTAKAADYFRSRSFLPAPTQAASVSQPLVAGGNIGAFYSSGDLVMGGIGTVTAVCGDKVYAFGHPMNFLGETSAVMTNASAAMIVPDGTGWVGPYKQVSQLGEPVGMITQDRFVGIRGTIGAVKTTPVEVIVRNSAGKRVKTYTADVTLPDALATATAYLTGQAAYTQLDAYNTGTAQVGWTVKYTRANGKAGTYKNNQLVADATGWFPDTAATYPANDVSAIASTSENVKITGVTVNLKLLDSNAVTYKPSAVQFKNSSGAWVSLSGASLKAGKSYSIRPVYQLAKNAKTTSTTSTGKARSFKLSSKARNAGSMSVMPATAVETVCEEDTCEDLSTSDLDFPDLLDTLGGATKTNTVVGEFGYSLKKGADSVTLTWDGPGVVLGTTTADFSIKK